MALRYRIEYLREASDERSVVTWFDAISLDLSGASIEGQDRLADAQRLHGATSFLVRDREAGNRVAYIENY